MPDTMTLIVAVFAVAFLCALAWWTQQHVRTIAELREGNRLLLSNLTRYQARASLPENQSAEDAYRTALEYIASGQVPMPFMYTDEQHELAEQLSGIAWWWLYSNAHKTACDAIGWDGGS